MRLTVVALLLAGCVEAKTPEGCTIYYGEIARSYTEACVQAYYEERARQSGGAITRCFGGDGQATCIAE